jgi:hypothetical protein
VPLTGHKTLVVEERAAHCRGLHMVRTADTLVTDELDALIARYTTRIEQQRIHVTELSRDPRQQNDARAELAATIAGLAKLQWLRKHFT